MDYDSTANLLATAGVNGSVKVWKGNTGLQVDSSPNIKHSNPVLAVKLYSGKNYVVSSSKNKIMAWDITQQQKPLWNLRTDSPIQAIDIFPKKNLISGVTDIGTFNTWKFRKFYFLRNRLKKKGTNGNVNNLTIPFINRVFMRRMSKGIADVKILPYKGKGRYRRFLGHKRMFFAENNSALMKGKILFSPKNISKYYIKEWSVFSRLRFKKLEGHHRNEITSIDFSPDEKYLVSGSKDSDIKIWDINLRKSIRTLKGHIAPITVVSFSQDGQYIFSADEDNRIKIWDTLQTQPLATIVSKTPEDYIIYTPDNYYLSSKGSSSDIHFIKNRFIT